MTDTPFDSNVFDTNVFDATVPADYQQDILLSLEEIEVEVA